MRYKPGDKVRVIGAQDRIDEMKKMIGSVCTIEKCGSCFYTLIEGLGFAWLEEWVELYEEGKDLDISMDEVIDCFGVEVEHV